MGKTAGKKSLYFGYYARLITNFTLYIVLFTVFVFLFILSFEFSEVQTAKYQESSHLNYWVYVHENEFYDRTYLEKDMLYIANLIDKIVVDFDYNFLLESKENLDLIYNITADLLITDSTGNKLYYKKSYDLLEDKKVSINNSNMQKINKQIDIDYDFYNSIANKFKTTYGVDASSVLNVNMTIRKSNNEKSNFQLDNTSTMKVTIPLTESAIDIKLDYTDINSSDLIIKDRTFNIKSIFTLFLSIASFIASICALVLFVKKLLLLKDRKNSFDRVVDKILKEYDFYIAETATLISFEGKQIIKIEKFSELLDIHDNLKLPIMYYLVNKHQKCYFYINHKDTIYLVTIKDIDLENKQSVKSLEERKRDLISKQDVVFDKNIQPTQEEMINLSVPNTQINQHPEANIKTYEPQVDISVKNDNTISNAITSEINNTFERKKAVDNLVIEKSLTLKSNEVNNNQLGSIETNAPNDINESIDKEIDKMLEDAIPNQQTLEDSSIDQIDLPILKENK